VKVLIDAAKFSLLASLTADEKKDDGKVHPPIAAMTLRFGFVDLKAIIVLIESASEGSIVTTSNGFFPVQSVEAQ